MGRRRRDGSYSFDLSLRERDPSCNYRPFSPPPPLKGPCMQLCLNLLYKNGKLHARTSSHQPPLPLLRRDGSCSFGFSSLRENWKLQLPPLPSPLIEPEPPHLPPPSEPPRPEPDPVFRVTFLGVVPPLFGGQVVSLSRAGHLFECHRGSGFWTQSHPSIPIGGRGEAKQSPAANSPFGGLPGVVSPAQALAWKGLCGLLRGVETRGARWMWTGCHKGSGGLVGGLVEERQKPPPRSGARALSG